MPNQKPERTSTLNERTFVFRAGRRLTGALGSAFPALAAARAERRFLTPRPTPVPPALAAAAASGAPVSFWFRGGRLAGWRWPSAVQQASANRAPLVLFVHGWEGGGLQFGAWVRPLTEAGYDVVAFDGPAHGSSAGAVAHLLDFAAAARTVADSLGPVHAVIAHSMGAAATAIALAEGLRADRAVFLAPPDNLETRARSFGRFAGLPDRAQARFERRLAARIGRPLESVRLATLARLIRQPVLVFHDPGDPIIPWSEGASVAALLPEGELRTTRNLGHFRLLRAPELIEDALAFLGSAADAEHPAPVRDLGLARFLDRIDEALLPPLL